MTSSAPHRDPEATKTHTLPGDVLPSGTRLADRYRILDLVGVGGMGRVYRAHDEELDLTVVLKVLRTDQVTQEDFRERFRRELILARQVSHRNVVRIHDLGFDGDLSFLTMDYVAGRPLLEVLEREGPLEVDRALHLVHQLLEALGAAHEEGVVHRDLKPSNLLVDDSDRLYVSDFGLARSVEVSGLTGTGWVMGTLHYLSPEQARGERADPRSDLYAVGLLLFEMLTGRLPFQQGTFAEVLAQRISGRARTLGEVGVRVPKFVDAAIRRCLERDPERRYSTAREMARDLEDRRVTGRVARRTRAAVHRFRRRPGRALALALATVAVLTLVALGIGIRLLPEREAVVRDPMTARMARNAVAVLPLVNETETEELAWASRGVAETLTAMLAESPELRVVDSPRVFRTLEDLELSPEALAPAELRLLGDLLDVDRLVAGRVRAVGEGVQLELRLVADGPAGLSEQRLRGERETEAGIFALVEDLGAELRQRLHVAAGDSVASPLSTSPAALSAYSRGMDRLLVGDHVRAVPPLEEAVAGDREFTAAWMRLAEAYEALGRGEEALEAARRAEALTGMSQRMSYEARARAAALAGEPERAREVLAELVERYPHDIEARVELAESFGDEGRHDRAEEILREVVREDPDHPRAWILLGIFAVYQGHYRQAVDEYFVHALVIQNRLRNRVGKARVLNALGAALQGLGDLDGAADRYREAAEIREEVGDSGGQADSLANLGFLEIVRGNTEAARRHLEQALEIRREIGDRGGMASLEDLWGGVEEQEGHYSDALDHYRRALQLRRALGDRRAEAESHYSIGFIYFVLGEYDTAEVHWNESLRSFLEVENRKGVALTRQGIGQLQLARGDWSGAQRSFLQALTVGRDTGAREMEAVSRGYLGRAAHHQGRYDAALKSYRAALGILEELEVGRGLAEFHLLAAATLLETGRPAEAKTDLEAARSRLRETGNREQRADLLRLEGELALAEGRAAVARESLERALAEAQASGSRRVELGVRLSLGNAELAAGDGDTLARLQEIVDDAERLGHVRLRLDSRTVLAKALRTAGNPVAAEEEAREALRLVPTVEPYGRTYRLHGLLAEILSAQGRDTEAAEQWELAARAVERVREHLPPGAHEAFEALPEVSRIVRKNPEAVERTDVARAGS